MVFEREIHAQRPSSKKLEKEMFHEILLQEAIPMGNAEENITQICKRIQKSFGASMSRRTQETDVQLLMKYRNLWTPQSMLIARSRPESEEMHNGYKKMRKELQVTK